MATREDLIRAIGSRYAIGTRLEKGLILDEFVAVTGLHRKHAMKLLRIEALSERKDSRKQRRQYGDAVREALIVIWEASDRICGKRLRPLVPTLVEAMERHGHLELDPGVRTQLLAMSAATMDRALRDIKSAGSRNRRRAGASTTLKRSIPIRTFTDWGDPEPGYFEADLVAHCGPVASGSFVQTLVLTDIATGWTECAPLLVREQTLLMAVLHELRQRLPVVLRGFDTDNDTVFINETIRDYCLETGIEFTRCRPYRKNDQAWVEQKNGSIVRRTVGYQRLEGIAATRVLATLYAATRLFVNFFQPSFKLAEKHRDGARVHKRYHAPATPHRRMLADPRLPEDARGRLQAIYETLDPVQLLRDIRAAQQRLVELSDATTTVALPVPLDVFLCGLKTAWRSGEIRPHAKQKLAPKRGRRRPDPLVDATEQLKAWFDAEPWRTARELLEKLQTEQTGNYPSGLLRTVQRRLKVWRAEQAHEMVFGAFAHREAVDVNESIGGAMLIPRRQAAPLRYAYGYAPQPGASDHVECRLPGSSNCAILGSIGVRQRTGGRGAFFGEAIRFLTLFVAPHPGENHSAEDASTGSVRDYRPDPGISGEVDRGRLAGPRRLPFPKPLVRVSTCFYATVCADRCLVDQAHRAGSFDLWHPFDAENEGFIDLPTHKEPPRGAASARAREHGKHHPIPRHRGG